MEGDGDCFQRKEGGIRGVLEVRLAWSQSSTGEAGKAW